MTFDGHPFESKSANRTVGTPVFDGCMLFSIIILFSSYQSILHLQRMWSLNGNCIYMHAMLLLERRKPCDDIYRCIERVHHSVGTLLCCDRGDSSTEKIFLGFN